ncbi:AI-2E family transporter [Bifidobacterium italicum]|nr:AI-2E family transporter [Bifidobacterium italicum]
MNGVEGPEGAEGKRKLDVASLFPAKGDPRRPPEWYGRALLYTAIAVFLAWFAYSSWFKITYIVFDVVIALFLALAVEPLIVRLIKHGWKRGVAAVTCLVGLIVIVITLLALFGNMFVQQMISMVKGFPDLYNQLASFVSEKTDFKIPEMNDLGGEIIKNIHGNWVTDFAGQAFSTTLGVFSSLLNFITALMVAFYIAIAGPRLRRSLCKWIAPSSQRRFLMTWTVVQEQISGFLFSRSILAAINAACMSVFLMVIKVPYWLPLALFCGIVSQFIPTIGTYLGGALPVMFAWGERSIGYAIGVVVFITIYQQIENLLLSPKISERTMDLNPCIAFLSVLFFGSIFGALGAFLALPITASIQVLLKVSMKQYPLVDVPLMNDPTTKKKSKMVEAADVINEHVLKPVGEHIPGVRQAKGSSAHISFDDAAIAQLREAAYGDAGAPVTSDSPTVAIPKRVLDSDHRRGLNEGGDGDGRAGSAAAGASPAADAPAPRQVESECGKQDKKCSASKGPDNPRSHWR